MRSGNNWAVLNSGLSMAQAMWTTNKLGVLYFFPFLRDGANGWPIGRSANGIQTFHGLHRFDQQCSVKVAKTAPCHQSRAGTVLVGAAPARGLWNLWTTMDAKPQTCRLVVDDDGDGARLSSVEPR